MPSFAETDSLVGSGFDDYSLSDVGSDTQTSSGVNTTDSYNYSEESGDTDTAHMIILDENVSHGPGTFTPSQYTTITATASDSYTDADHGYIENSGTTTLSGDTYSVTDAHGVQESVYTLYDR